MKKIIAATLALLLSLCLCGCGKDFETARSALNRQKNQQELSRPTESDLEIISCGPDYTSHSYSYIDLVGTVKNNLGHKISSATLKLYFYDSNDKLVKTDITFCTNIPAYGEDSFKFLVSDTDIYIYRYEVKVSSVY